MKWRLSIRQFRLSLANKFSFSKHNLFWRELSWGSIIFLSFIPLFYTLFKAQFLERSVWEAFSRGQNSVDLFRAWPRKEIYDLQGRPLVIEKKIRVLRVDPFKVKNKALLAQKLSEILGIPEKDILEKLSLPYRDVRLKEDLSQEEVVSIQKIKERDGVYLPSEWKRFYLTKDLGAVFIGFVDREGRGRYGIEGFYDEFLRQNSSQPLILTVDARLQEKAFELLQKYQEKLQYSKGEIIVMDPFSGEIKALAQIPSYDPNRYYLEPIERFKILALQEPFEPGSVMKPFVVASALQEKLITPDTFYYDKGYVDIGGWRIFNYGQKKWGKRSVREILKYSINTGAVFVEQKLGKDRFRFYLERLGVFEKSGVDLATEVVYPNEGLKQPYEVNLATASFGQGVALNSFQLLRAWASLINGGELVQPHFVKKQPRKVRVFSPEVSFTMIELLKEVVEEGSGRMARSSLYTLGGKTGTAQIPWTFLGEKKKGYSPYTIQSFVGFGPTTNPRFLVLVKLYTPKTLTAEYSAAPIFKEMIEYALLLYNVPPDKPSNTSQK